MELSHDKTKLTLSTLKYGPNGKSHTKEIDVKKLCGFDPVTELIEGQARDPLEDGQNVLSV